MERKARHKL